MASNGASSGVGAERATFDAIDRRIVRELPAGGRISSLEPAEAARPWLRAPLMAGGFDDLFATAVADMTAHCECLGHVIRTLSGLREIPGCAVKEEVKGSSRLRV